MKSTSTSISFGDKILHAQAVSTNFPLRSHFHRRSALEVVKFYVDSEEIYLSDRFREKATKNVSHQELWSSVECSQVYFILKVECWTDNG